MDPKDFFRGFFGIPRNNSQFPNQGQDFEEFEENHEQPPNENQPHFRGSFRVFTNPMEMEQFFNQQFDEMLKIFGGFSGPNHSGIHPGFGQNPNFGQNPGFEHQEENGARDFMLKKEDSPGYLKPEQRNDSEMAQIPSDLDKLYQPETPISRQPRFNFSSQSFSSSSVRLPDGSMEQTRITKDSEGKEITTVTKKNGEDCLTVTTIKHPDGRQEQHESNACSELNDFKFGMQRQLPNQDEDLVDRLFRF